MTPMACIAAACSAVSTPSAMVSMPSSRDVDLRLHQCAVDRAGGASLHKTLVDLEQIDRQVSQGGEGRHAGAKIVQRKSTADFLQGLDEVDGFRDVGYGRGLGDLEYKLLRVDARRVCGVQH